MTILLTQDERNRIAKQAKQTRPTYFNAASNDYLTISEDFESFIILSPQKTRNSVIEWINKNQEQLVSYSKRDQLLTECLQSDLTYSQTQLDEANKTLTEFDEFRTQFQNTNTSTEDNPEVPNKLSRFSAVIEVGTMLDDLQRSTDELVMVRNRAKHLNTVTKVLQTILQANSVSEAQQRQSKSWAGPWTAYSTSGG